MADSTSHPRTQRIGIFVYQGFEPIDVFGFAEAFTIARFLGTGYGSPPPYPFEVFLIARQVGKVTSANGPSVFPDCDLDQALNVPPDLLMIPGGGGTWPLLDDKADPDGVRLLLDWVRAIEPKVRVMASVCTRAAVLARVIGELDDFVGQQLKRPAYTPLRWVGAGRGEQKRFLLARQLTRRTRARLFRSVLAQDCLRRTGVWCGRQSTHRRNAGGDRCVSDPAIGGQQDLGSFQLARGMVAAT